MAGQGKGGGTPARLSNDQWDEAVHWSAHYAGRGYNLRQIAGELEGHLGRKVSHVTVGKCLEVVRQDYAKRVQEARPLLLQEKLDQLRDVRREAWQAYELSKGETGKVVEECAPPIERGAPTKGGRFRAGPSPRDQARAAEKELVKLRVTITREKRGPADRYLQIVLKTLEVECELLGLYPEEGQDTGGDGEGKPPLDWDAMTVPRDPAELELERLERAAGTGPQALPPRRAQVEDSA